MSKSASKTTAATGPLLAAIRPELDAAERAAKISIAQAELDAMHRYNSQQPARLKAITGPLFAEPNPQQDLF